MDSSSNATWALFSKSKLPVAALPGLRCSKCERLMSPDECGAELPAERVCDACANPKPIRLHRRSTPKGGSRKAIYESLGMVQVRGARGGIFYE